RRSSLSGADILKFDIKKFHLVSEPEVSRLGIVGGHAETVLHRDIQFVEQMRVNPNPDRDREITATGLAREVLIFHAAYCKTAGLAAHDCTRRGRRIPRYAQIVCHGVGGAQGNDPQGRRTSPDPLPNVMNWRLHP